MRLQRQLGLHSFCERRYCHEVLFFYKIVNGLLPNFYLYLEFSSNSRCSISITTRPRNSNVTTIWGKATHGLITKICSCYPNSKTITAWEVSVFGNSLVRIFLHLDWIRRDTPNLFVFSPNEGKYGPRKLRIRKLST